MKPDRILLADDSPFWLRIKDELINQLARDLPLVALVQINVIVQVALLLAARGLPAQAAIRFALLSLLLILAAMVAGLAVRLLQSRRIVRYLLASSTVFLMDISLALAPILNAVSEPSVEAIFVLAVVMAATAVTVPLFTKILWPFLTGKLLIIASLFFASLQAADTILLTSILLIFLLSLWSSGYALHLQSVRTVHLSSQLQRTLDAERLASQKVRRDYEGREELLRRLSHDLRQPINAVGLLLHQLKSQVDGPGRDEILRMCRECVLSANAALEDVLRRAQDSTLNVIPAKQPIALQSVFDRLCAQFAESACNKGLRLVVVRSHTVVVTDEHLLERILGNLLQNAIRYTDRGKVLLGVKRDGVQSAIIVADCGPGLRDEAKRFLFSQSPGVPRDKRASEGYGLGLHIVRDLTQAIGAKLDVRTRRGRGTLFRVVLPAEAARASHPGQFRQADFSGRHIVVVDDDRDACAALHSVLKPTNALVESYQERKDIRALVSMDVSDVDLFLLDYDLGEGVTVFDLLDTWPQLSLDRVVVITGHADMTITGEVEHRGMRLLTKPVHAEILLDTCRKVLSPDSRP